MDHEVHTFLQQDLAELTSEYDRIRNRTIEDPGTAGDEGEENWKHLLREWIPPNYPIVTKGRIVSSLGEASPQIDVLILKPFYPARLLSKKLYLSSGVAAAFECKNTLRAHHLAAAMESSVATKRLLISDPPSTPRQLGHGPIMYGILAHAHEWVRPASTPVENVVNALKGCLPPGSSPAEVLDLVCVATLDTWVKDVEFLMRRHFPHQYWHGAVGDRFELGPDVDGVIKVCIRSYDAWPSNPLGTMISSVVSHLAWTDVAVRPLADYLRQILHHAGGSGPVWAWPTDQFDGRIIDGVEAHRTHGWNEWASAVWQP